MTIEKTSVKLFRAAYPAQASSLFNFFCPLYINSNTCYTAGNPIGHLGKPAFSDFSEMSPSFNSLYYRELKHHIYRVTSKNCSF